LNEGQQGESNIYGSEFAEAVIDNPGGAKRTIRFETGRLAKQAAGSVTIYQGDTLVLSAATASKRPKENLDFFPLTVDVEERMYAAGKIPGSFFRREGRPSEDAILTCRLTDRPLRPSFKKGLRNEVQVVSTVLALDPDHLYDVLAINSAAAAVLLSGLPFTGPVGATRVACINGEWVAFPTHTELEDATFDMVVAGRMLDDGDVAIMMVEAEATKNVYEVVNGGGTAPTEEIVAAGLEAAKPAIAAVCKAQLELKAKSPKEPLEFPVFLDYDDDVLNAVTAAAENELAEIMTIAGKQERESKTDVPLTDQVAGAPQGRQGQGPHRRPRPRGHPPARRRGRGPAPRPRLGAVRARRDPDHGRHHAEHAAHGADGRHAQPGEPQAVHAQLQLPAVLHR
jgi:polyribonucleotide nucleotidyltransferase